MVMKEFCFRRRASFVKQWRNLCGVTKKVKVKASILQRVQTLFLVSKYLTLFAHFSDKASSNILHVYRVYPVQKKGVDRTTATWK
jgi:hypothetical protein